MISLIAQAQQMTPASPWWSDLIKNVIGAESAWFWAMVQAIAVTVTLLLIFRQVKLQRLGNMLVSIHTLDHRWMSSQMIRYRVEICSDPHSNEVNCSDAADAILVFFEDIGMNVERGILDNKLVWDTYSVYVEFYWPILEPKVKEQWNKGDKTFYENFGKLYERMTKISKKKGLKPEKTKEQIAIFAASEVSRIKLANKPNYPTAGNAPV